MIRAFQWDLARQVERLDWLQAQLPHYAAWGYEELHLHLEDAVDYPSLPGVARADAYSWREFQELIETASHHGIKVVPIANLLGHTQYLIKTPQWRELNELLDPDGSPAAHGQICPDHPRTLEVAELLIADLRSCCTAGKLHVGLDESFHLGKHPRSRAEIDREGLSTYFANYVQKLHQSVESAGLKMAMWADMLIMLPEAIPQLPPGIAAYDWYYHGFRKHPRFELYNFKDYDLSPPLAHQQIDYWACPMNGAFRHEPLPVFGERLANAVAWWQRAKKVDAKGFLVSSWEPSHLTPELTSVIDAAIAGLWLDGDSSDHATLLRRGFRRATSISRPSAESRLALACDERAFAGYAQAERNSCWDTSPLTEGTSREAAKIRFFGRAIQRAQFGPLRTSLRWRCYLARREYLVRTGAREILRTRRLLAREREEEARSILTRLIAEATSCADEIKTGKAAADELWKLTRNANSTGPNHEIIRQDRQRLTAWKRWLTQALRNPAKVNCNSPLVGVWQLELTVHATRPNANAVVVQQQDATGEWRDLRQRHTIEFRSAVARRRSIFKRGWSVPISNPDLPLRLALRGVGEVTISQVSLTNGLETRRNRTWSQASRQRLGTSAPESGWPHLDWAINQDVVALAF
ncbi:MAG: hypothetical protein SynsKO_11080 [Synoicihabitans sp.]